jgi:hypothetical protein
VYLIQTLSAAMAAAAAAVSAECRLLQDFAR